MMRTSTWRCLVALLLLPVLIPVVAQAQSYAALNYQPMYGVGFATDKEMEAALGTLRFSMSECREIGLGTSEQRVRVTSTKWAYQNQRVIETMLYRAVQFAWQNCEIHFLFGFSHVAAVHRNVDSVTLYLPDGSEALQASNLSGDDTFDVGKSYRWMSPIVDVGEQNRQEAARRAAQQEQQRRLAEARARSSAEWDKFWSNVWFGIKLFFWGGIAVWLFSKREILMRWYYLLTPHPATSMVEGAIDRGVELDGKAFAEIMRPIPGGRIEKEVRAQQAHALAERAHRYAETMRAEAERLKAKAEQDAEFIRAQDELVKAATVHEKAKARLDALRKRMG